MNSGKNRFAGAACLGLALAVILCYWPVARHQFINVDDPQYILQNSHVAPGLTWSGVCWAFQSGYASNWHPLTWISHMVDCSLFGLNPAGPHVMNLLFHTANTVLLFLLLLRLTGAGWRSVIVAGLFGLHPLHIESVAWASERKDVLSALFFFLTIWSYAIWVERRSLLMRRTVLGGEVSDAGAKRLPGATLHYLLALFFFACGLMSKPMLVTTPFVLLLLDYWPLGRIRLDTANRQAGRFAALVREKVPFFVLAMGDSIATYLAQRGGGSVAASPSLPASLRVANAIVSYVRYIGHTVWPAGLAAIYPYPKSWPAGVVIAAALAVGAITLFCCLLAKRRPYLPFGWFWYLGMLVPAIGLVQVGPQAMADRYMYLPGIGLFVVLVWGLHDLLVPLERRREIALGAATAALAGCLGCTFIQVQYWRDGVTLFTHALAVTRDNFIAYDYLGSALNAAGRPDEALASFAESVRLERGNPEAQFNFGTALLDKGDLEQAVPHLAAALAGNPGFAPAHVNLGNAFFRLGRLSDAEIQLSRAVALESDNPSAHYNLGSVELALGRAGKAEKQFAEAVRLAPGYAQAHSDLGVALAMQGKTPEAIAHFAEAVRLVPGDPEKRFNLGLALLDQNRSAEAAAQFVEGLRLRPDDTRMHYRLAVALERQHKIDEAIAQYREALRLTPEFPEARSELAQLLASGPRQ